MGWVDLRMARKSEEDVVDIELLCIRASGETTIRRMLEACAVRSKATARGPST